MILSIHQPAYLPWLGYFERIALSDKFVFLDCVQFEKNSFTNRNKVKTANGPTFLTIPVKHKGHMSGTLADLKINGQQNWQVKHLRTIEQAYKKAPFFKDRFDKFRQLYDTETDSLADLCFNQLEFWLHEFGIKTEIIRASELSLQTSKADLVLEICKTTGAKTYLSGPLGRNYLEPMDFDTIGVELKFQEFCHPVYPQLHGEFVAGMGAVDYWFMQEKYYL